MKYQAVGQIHKPYDNCHICNVKDRPDAKIKHVRDSAFNHTVDKITSGTANDQRQAVGKQCFSISLMQIEINHDSYDNQGKNHKENCFVFEQTKGSAGVFNIGEVKNILQKGNAFAQNHL